MTKINHRHNSLFPARRTSAAFDSASKCELAYLDAVSHMQAERLRYGKSTTLTQFIYEQAPKRRDPNGGSR